MRNVELGRNHLLHMDDQSLFNLVSTRTRRRYVLWGLAPQRSAIVGFLEKLKSIRESRYTLLYGRLNTRNESPPNRKLILRFCDMLKLTATSLRICIENCACDSSGLLKYHFSELFGDDWVEDS